ncbi:anaerobic C4-dicarboxylate transporter [Solihabitans fulvus]|uniref:Anaerobic C4-dicarboxylate transporter n=1 Tax=Solihabitans fulvus TaxID=1892852 RepID=A0A5B2X4F0_9PSEU|nr:anaerobic C4-dicarboxylate transporter family protein [Solihabitans fulvus]KAA2258035.1 anaerobic C4-dicarboxylate transporter [Solihabitans fulvus]
MHALLVVAEALVVLAAIGLGVHTGGIGLGLWGIAGTAVLVFGFGLNPGSPPTDAFFIIVAVITASATMQAAGGTDFLVGVASRIIRRNPRRITYVAPLVAFVFTMGAGTSNIFFTLIPVIYETAYRNGIRPERPLAAATVTSGLGITASPVSAAMAAYVTLLPKDFTLAKILTITVPAALVACVVTSVVQSRIGRELTDDPEFQRRVREGLVEPVPAAATGDEPADDTRPPLPNGAARSAYVFLVAVVLIVVLGLVDRLRPMVTIGGQDQRLSMTVCIELIMFSTALVILLWNRIKPESVIAQPLTASGIVASVALFGIAWMADTFISGNQDSIVRPLGQLVQAHPLLLAVALFLVTGVTTSQSAATRTIVPLGLGPLGAATVTALWPSLIGVWLFPANGAQIAAVNIDKTGSTRLGRAVVYHSFTIPMLVSWVASSAVGLVISRFV